MNNNKHIRVCKNGHRYYKTSDCPTCPVCEAAKKPDSGFMALLSAPARRALQGAGINTLTQLAAYTEAEVLALHGMGPSSIPKLRQALAGAHLSFRQP